MTLARTNLVNAGPFDYHEMPRLFEQEPLADVRSGWQACIVDAMTMGEPPTTAQMALILAAVHRRLIER